MSVLSSLRPAGPAPQHVWTDVPGPGTRVHSRAWHPGTGTGRTPVVLLHGLGLSSRYLIPLGRRLAALGHDVVAPDLPGFGRSPRDRRLRRPGGPDVATQTGQLVEWLDAAGIGRASFFGNSIGAQVAVELAARHPDRVDRVVLSGSTPDPRYRRPWKQYPQVLRNMVFEVPGLQPVLQVEYLSTGVARMVQQLVRSCDDPIEQRLPRVAAPTLVVRGRHDRTLTQEWAEEVTRLLPDGRLVVIEGAAHNAHWSAPDVSARLVAAFLAGRLDGPDGGGPAGDGVVVPRSAPGDPLAAARPLPPRAHAALDVVTTLALLTVPWTRPWGPRTRLLLAASGAAGLADTLLTDHPAGLLRVLPVPVHLNLEASAGLQLLTAAATWLRGEPAAGRWAAAGQGVFELLRAGTSSAPAGPARRVPVPR
ncbi:Pimeloyl-ACP methyl ester carboxylesterase [Geodermatophilus saharensis]|uniref:Pimeloyl-ACP methyl ester carboxylesterase n=1 Tax=Geodermatophilus saharensis TaxID=1137994 RepID=A0A239IZ60_9ACTN|nr:alpha/beta hydrolase [Geodermatophilus saharensis]SNS97714.1 Pimeloyl-ACP methyl ester carboxylesterase [Geodermatophilus saharensis]